MMRTNGAPLTRPPEPRPLERLFEEHHATVFRAAYRVTGNAADAEDVLQTVFLRLASRDDLPSINSGYLARAAVNAGLDVVRSRATRKDVDLDDAALPAAGPATDPQQREESREARGRLRAALAELPPRMAEVFCLRHLQGLPNREIAPAVGLSAGAVAILLFRAKARLQLALRSEV